MPPPAKLLGLDVGEATIGIAISDNLGITAQGLTTRKRRGLQADLRFLQQLVHEHNVAAIVVGLPRRLDGSLGPEAQRVLEFVSHLRQALSLPVYTWDERLTTRAAERILLEGNLRRAKRKQVIDKIAAQLILQGYLDRQRSRQHSSTQDAPEGKGGEEDIRSPGSNQGM
ncbi:MAG: Holliday junction resolvase RuvX [Nitrospinota bacterium]|nr:MAG: Holliday junction resolvase RuvX [Nitrospinota bacterium]